MVKLNHHWILKGEFYILLNLSIEFFQVKNLIAQNGSNSDMKLKDMKVNLHIEYKRWVVPFLKYSFKKKLKYKCKSVRNGLNSVFLL